jgi:CBS domain containing-hemolysin-like protein
MPHLHLIIGAIFLIVLAGCCAASEAALSRVSRSRAAELVLARRRGSRALARIAADPAQTLSVTAFLRVLAESSAAIVIAAVMLDVTSPWWRGVVLAVTIMTAASFVAVGVGPRTLGRQHADRVGLVVGPVLFALTRVLGPLARLLVVFGNVITPGKGLRDGPFASEAELRELVDMAGDTQVIEAGEREMIHSVFELGDTVTREVMVPRTALVSVREGTSLRSAMSLFLRSGFSRIPVIGHGEDDVLGVVYLKDVVRQWHEQPESARTQTVDQVMREPVFVPDSKPVDELLGEMQRRGGHAAIVVDEYGGTAGFVTLEDLVEEIVGEISDEYDHDEPDAEPLADDVYRVRARAHVEQVGDLFGVDLDDEEVDTVGGLLSKALGRVPIAGAKARVGGLLLTADRFEGRRNQLATVLVERDRADEPAEP